MRVGLIFATRGPERRISMNDARAGQRSHEMLLADLACARATLVDIHLRAIKQVIAARAALGIASVAGFGPGTVCFTNGEGKRLTVAQVADLVKELAANEDQVRNLIAQVDVQSTRILRSISGRRH
jgi:hypothetical protein